MEQNLVSDEELIKRINDVLNDSEEQKRVEQLDNSSAEKFHDVSEGIEANNNLLAKGERRYTAKKDLELENQILASQLEAERRKTKELQTKFQLFENSVKYFERLNGQLETLKQTVEEDNIVLNDQGDYISRSHEAMQKLRPKTVHTAANGCLISGQEENDEGITISGEPHSDTGKDSKTHPKTKRLENKDEIAFRDAEDFKQLDQGLEIVKDKEGGNDSEIEKVFITKTEKKCLEDIGNLASRMRTPLDDKHQRFFEKDRRRFANRIVMPETQEVDKSQSVPPDLVSKTKETPVNITSTELDGLRSYLLQLKELIARRETAWARTTERDYNQRVEITRFKNEVSHLRMLCEKRQKDIKERDQIIVAKDEEIKELQKRVQGLKSAMVKFEKKDDRDRVQDTTLDNLAADVLENSQLVQKSYNVMKRASLMNKNLSGIIGNNNNKNGIISLRRAASGGKESKRGKPEKGPRKIKSTSSNSNDDDPKTPRGKTKLRTAQSEKVQKVKHRNENSPRKSSIERVDEKLQRIEEMLHSDVLKGDKKSSKQSGKKGLLRMASEIDPSFQKFTPTNSKMRQEMMSAMTGLNLGQKQNHFSDSKRPGNAAVLANALLAARNTSLFNF